MQKAKIGCWFLPKKAFNVFCVIVLAYGLVGCQKEGMSPDTSGNMRLKAVSFDVLDGWQNEDFMALIPVFAKNCTQIQKSKKEYFESTGVRIKTSDLQSVCHRFEAEKIRRTGIFCADNEFFS